jgi:hypothetical protein
MANVELTESENGLATLGLSRYILVFSGASDISAEPDYAMSYADGLTKRIGEILALHHEQQIRHLSTASPR